VKKNCRPVRMDGGGDWGWMRQRFAARAAMCVRCDGEKDCVAYAFMRTQDGKNNRAACANLFRQTRDISCKMT